MPNSDIREHFQRVWDNLGMCIYFLTVRIWNLNTDQVFMIKIQHLSWDMQV